MRKEVIDPMFEENQLHPIIMLETAINTALTQIVGKGFPVQSSAFSVSYLVHIAMIVHGFACLIIPVECLYRSTGKTINSANQYYDLIRLMDQYGQKLEKIFLTESPGYLK